MKPPLLSDEKMVTIINKTRSQGGIPSITATDMTLIKAQWDECIKWYEKQGYIIPVDVEWPEYEENPAVDKSTQLSHKATYGLALEAAKKKGRLIK